MAEESVGNPTVNIRTLPFNIKRPTLLVSLFILELENFVLIDLALYLIVSRGNHDLSVLNYRWTLLLKFACS